MSSIKYQDKQIEWPTLVLLGICYSGCLLITVLSQSLGSVLTVITLSMLIVLHSSLQHEIIHGHPFKTQVLNEVLVILPVGLFIPFLRFRDTHLAHHIDPNLTDPYDDPESNYLNPSCWAEFPIIVKLLFEFNNTLLGRMLIGPIIGLLDLYAKDITLVLKGERKIITAYLVHFAGVFIIFYGLSEFSSISILSYCASAYFAMSILKIRTFLEHRAHEKASQRTVIIEDRGLLAFLFLNNNFHLIHHAYPKLQWYKLPSFYASQRDKFDKRNGGYYYRSYLEVFRDHFLRVKDPVPHPFMVAPLKRDINLQIQKPEKDGI